jgi:hypothetical protein
VADRAVAAGRPVLIGFVVVAAVLSAALIA